MNFHEKQQIPSKYIYLFFSVICFILIIISVIFEDRFSPLKAVTSTIVTPMQSGINKVGVSIYNKTTNWKEKDELIAENKELSDKLDSYSAKIKIYEQESYELKRLHKLLDLQEQYVNYDTTVARVIATDSTNWFYTFVINKGEKDGIQVGCNVLAGEGLAGIVTEVGSDYAKVRAIIDDNSNISANIAGTDTLCTVSGDLSKIDDGYISVHYINKADKIEEGSELVTSHVSNKFLPGLLIGYISDISMDANNLTKSAKCIPVVDFHNLQEVVVILDLKEKHKTDSLNKNIYDNLTKEDDNKKTDESNKETTPEKNTSSKNNEKNKKSEEN